MKRKLDDGFADVEDNDQNSLPDADAPTPPRKKSKKSRSKKHKARKADGIPESDSNAAREAAVDMAEQNAIVQEQGTAGQVESHVVEDAGPVAEGETGEGRKKKQKKKKKSSVDVQQPGNAADSETAAQDAVPPDQNEARVADDVNAEEAQNQPEAKAGRQTRFIAFVGNLPFTATVESVQRHFASLKPISVRLGKKRDDPTKTRGFAFVEFATIGHMKTALEHFHHSEIDDGKGGKRKINVELTAGGGGKNSKRRERIKAKNEKLNERRQKRLKAEQEAKAAKKAQAGNDAKGNSSSSKPEEEALVDKDHADVHPSRRNQVQLADRKRRKKHN